MGINRIEVGIWGHPASLFCRLYIGYLLGEWMVNPRDVIFSCSLIIGGYFNF